MLTKNIQISVIDSAVEIWHDTMLLTERSVAAGAYLRVLRTS